MQVHSIDNLTPPKAQKYQAMKNRLFLFNLILEFVFLFSLVATGASGLLKTFLAHFSRDFYIGNALYFICFGGIAFLVFLPLDFYGGYYLEKRFGLSKESFRDWLWEAFKQALLVFIVSLVLIEIVYYFLAAFPDSWWLGAAGAWFFISVILSKIFPKIILPLFYKCVPLGSGDLREKIFALFLKYKVGLKDVYILDFSRKTVKANAMVAGLGRTKQIFLSDTLVSGFSPEEIEAVLSHELGHYLAHDTFKITLAGLCSALASFYGASVILDSLVRFFSFQGISDIAGLPLFLAVLLLAGLVLLPVQNSYSRFLEKRADRFALKVTGAPVAFITMMQRLGEKNLSEFSPSKVVEIFLYDHPPLAQRIKMAQAIEEAKGKRVC